MTAAPVARTRAACAVLALVLTSATACSTSGNKGTPTGPGGGDSTGSLAVTISVPSGITPAVTILGPDGYSKNVTSSATLTGLVAGSYSIVAMAAMGPNPIVGVPYGAAVTGSPATVTAHATASTTVVYTQRASEGLLLVSHGPVSTLTAAQLTSSGTPTPTRTLSGRSTTQLAVDASGGVWVCYAGGDTISYYTQAQVLAGGTPTPAVTILAPGSYADLAGVALDAKGGLWVTDRVNNRVYGYTPEQLTTSGSPTPAITITAGIGTLDGPWGLAFDPAGNLWVANVNDSTIVAYDPSALSKGGGQVPFAGIALPTGSVYSLAFDASGNLWTGDLHGVKEFPPADLTGVGSPTAAVAINPSSTPIIAALAFDASGDLWMADEAAGKIYMYTPRQLGSSGSVTPTTTLGNASAQDVTIGLPTGLAFSPHAATLPLH